MLCLSMRLLCLLRVVLKQLIAILVIVKQHSLEYIDQVRVYVGVAILNSLELCLHVYVT